MIVLSTLLALSTQTASLTDLEKLAAAKSTGADWTAAFKDARTLNEGVSSLVEGDLLNANEFERASQVVRFMNNDFRIAEMRYELCLAGLASGDLAAAKTIAAKWDDLMVSMSRPRRIGVFSIPGARYRVQATYKGVLEVYKNPDKAKRAATESQLHAEIKKIVDADQADRQIDFSKLRQKDLEAISERDKARQRRIKQLLGQGAPKTAEDFANAALVLQHGEVFDDYALAHELCVASMILGNAKAAWLSGASYDRMLVNGGHPQRFATQYNLGASGYELTWFDPAKINDSMRRAVVRVTLEQAKNRKWD